MALRNTDRSLIRAEALYGEGTVEVNGGKGIPHTVVRNPFWLREDRSLPAAFVTPVNACDKGRLPRKRVKRL